MQSVSCAYLYIHTYNFVPVYRETVCQRDPVFASCEKDLLSPWRRDGFFRGIFLGGFGIFFLKKVNDQSRCAGPIPFCEFCEYAPFRLGNFLKFAALCIFVLLFACMYALNLCIYVTIFVYVRVHIHVVICMYALYLCMQVYTYVLGRGGEEGREGCPLSPPSVS